MVYVDPNFEWPKSRKWPFGSVSHMYADKAEELHALAKKIGLKREWCSDHTQPDSTLLHYDLSPKMREKAVRAGAKEVSHAHGEPYRLRGVWCWKQFREHFIKVYHLKPLMRDFPEWEGVWRMFMAGSSITVEELRRQGRLTKPEGKEKKHGRLAKRQLS